LKQAYSDMIRLRAPVTQDAECCQPLPSCRRRAQYGQMWRHP